jgi:anaerobic magnesium-protoporphyrin IX monomethyl ester cyclase
MSAGINIHQKLDDINMMTANKILLFNPRATDYKARIPNSVLQVAASIEGKYPWVFVDGNLEADPAQKIKDYLLTGAFKFFAATVMPGPQLRQAIPITKMIRQEFPDVVTVWGGYFPSNHAEATLASGYVDFVVNGPGDKAFPDLIEAILENKPLDDIHNLIFMRAGQMVKTPKVNLYPYDELPDLPYEQLSRFYPISRYLGKSFMGKRTIAYHSSFGCPFKCSFCAVVPIYQGKWNGKSAENIYKDIKYLKETYGGDAIEFHDNNFFVSEKRTVAFAQLIKNEGISWWGEARIDTVDKYSDESLALMRDSGCKMIFFGAESGSDQLLEFMDKGGKQSGAQILHFAKRLKQFGIIPEYSFVLGWPAANEQASLKQVESEINFIRQVKDINPDTEIIIYIYSPVPTEGSEMFKKVKEQGFSFPQKLEDWLAPAWEQFDLRRNPLTPWLTPRIVQKIRDFETVLNAYYPTVTDTKLSNFQRKMIRTLASWRYRNQLYQRPYELKFLQRFWLKYRQPEKEGF